jgi:hypothetical protein
MLKSLGISDKLDNCAGFPMEAENGNGTMVCAVRPGNKFGTAADIDDALKDKVKPKKTKTKKNGARVVGAGIVIISIFLVFLI